MTDSDDELKRLLADAESAADALGAAIRLGKARHPKQTLGFLAKRAGIPSTGYLSDVASGRRRLHAKYRDGLLAALGIHGTGAELIGVLLALDELKSEDPEKGALEQEREALRKLLRQQTRSLPERLAGMFFAFEVFAAFGLTGQKATRASLRNFFGAARGIEVEKALALLVQAGLIERRDEEFHVVSNQVNFIGGEDGMSHLDYLTMGLRDAEAKVGEWFGKKDESFFLSSIVSVKDAEYRAGLPKLKDAIRRIDSDLESGEADRLVRFNVQLYPLR